jgi:hypothetical protein
MIAVETNLKQVESSYIYLGPRHDPVRALEVCNSQYVIGRRGTRAMDHARPKSNAKSIRRIALMAALALERDAIPFV